jgi:tRNA(Ile)-lysidine synthase
MPNALPEAAVTRFSNAVSGLVAPADRQSMGVCVSGGPDSVALLLLARAAFPGVEAATVDHGLRPESAREAADVARICGDLGLRHEALRLADRPAGNLQDWARKARYAALEHWADTRGRSVLLTAHHVDDQLETLLMRLNRGSGVGGLAGIRARNGRVVRPLLGWRKAELEALVRDAGVLAADDPSNRDARFDRARLRAVLSTVDWIDADAASRSAAALAEADAALAWAAEECAAVRVTDDAGGLGFDPAGVPAEIVRRVVARCLTRIDTDAAPRGEALDRLISALWAGETATLAGVKCWGGDLWHFAAAPPRVRRT